MRPATRCEFRAAALFGPLAVSLLVLGCASWGPDRPPVEPPPPTSVSRYPGSRIVFESRTLRTPPELADAQGELWAALDETSVPLDVRRRWADNGLRVGIVPAVAPPYLDALRQHPLNQPRLEDVEASGDVALQLPPSAAGGEVEVPLIPGTPGRIVATPPVARLTLLVAEDGQVRGRSFDQARGFFRLGAEPSPDGRVALTIVPEVQYGPPQARVVGSQGSFSLDQQPNYSAFDRLRLEARLEPGQTVVIGTTPDWKGLGRQFLADDRDGLASREIVLLRLKSAPEEAVWSAGEEAP